MNREEFREIYETHADRLMRLAVAVGGEGGAEDVVAETFVRCWQRWRTHPPDHAGAYLRRALVNELIRGSERPPSGMWPATETPDVAQRVDDRVVALELLGQLPRRQRAVLALRYLEDCSEAETADLLDMRLGTVKSVASRGLRRLQELAAGQPDLDRAGRHDR